MEDAREPAIPIRERARYSRDETHFSDTHTGVVTQCPHALPFAGDVDTSSQTNAKHESRRIELYPFP